MMQCQALWYADSHQVELRDLDIPRPQSGEVLVKAHFSGLSRGTERIIYNGRVPQSEYTRMRCPYQGGQFPFPVKYGYSFVGKVVDGAPDQIGRSVFVLHPHQEIACVSVEDLHEIPHDLSLRRAVLTANTETAINVIWDADPSPGERILVVGGGILGLLVAGLAGLSGENEITVVDTNPNREKIAQDLGANFTMPDAAPNNQDVVIHTSATETGLRKSLDCVADEGRIIEASWFGDLNVSLPLGEAFHSRRLRIISSQVGAVPRTHREQWTPKKRIQKALDHLGDERFDSLITGEIAFTEAPKKLPDVFAGGSSELMTAIRYS